MVYLGIDIGSLSCDAVLIDENKNILASSVVPTGARNVEAIQKVKEVVMDEESHRHKPSDLRLAPKDPNKYYNRSQTKARINALQGMEVDVVNKDDKVQSTWKIVTEALMDPDLVAERDEHFKAEGVCGIVYDSHVFDFEKYFF